MPVRIQDVKFIKSAPNRVMPDITKLRKTFGYKPEVGIEEGLRRTIEWNKSINTELN